MPLNLFFGLLNLKITCWLLQILLAVASAEIVNLTKQAEDYIYRLNGSSHNIISWSLNESYSYWHNSSAISEGLFPIRGNVTELTCYPPMTDHNSLGPESGVQMIAYTWNITKTIYVPFPLHVKVKILQASGKGFKKQDFLLTVKGGLQRMWTPRRPPKGSLKGARVYTESCKLTAKVTIDGVLVYESMTSERNTTVYSTVPVGVLCNDCEGTTKDQNKLTLTLHGQHIQRVFLKDMGNFKHRLV